MKMIYNFPDLPQLKIWLIFEKRFKTVMPLFSTYEEAGNA